MSDDGTGAHVNIPTFLIGKSSGDKIKAQVHKSEVEGSNSTHHRWQTGNHSRHSRNWWNRGHRGGYLRRGHQVIILADLDFSGKSNSTADVDIWYSSVYELSQTMWDLNKFSQMEDLFQGAVKFQPRIAMTDCRWCSKAIKEKQCVFDGKYCPYKPYSVATK